MSTLTPTSAQKKPREHVITAVVNGHPVGVAQGHRIAGERYGAVLVSVVAPVGLTLAEVAAVLFQRLYTPGGSLAAAREALADDDHLRRVVAGVVVNRGCLQAEEALFTALDVASADRAGAALLAYCSRRALAVFGEVSR